MTDGYQRLYEDLFAARRAEEKAAQAKAELAATPLFGGEEPAPPHNGTATSKAAAALVAPSWGVRKVKVMEAIVDAEEGMTRLELVAATGLAENSINSCVRSLLDHGELVESGERNGRHILFHPRFVVEEKAA